MTSCFGWRSNKRYACSPHRLLDRRTPIPFLRQQNALTTLPSMADEKDLQPEATTRP